MNFNIVMFKTFPYILREIGLYFRHSKMQADL